MFLLSKAKPIFKNTFRFFTNGNRDPNFGFRQILDKMNQKLDSLFSRVPPKSVAILIVGGNVIGYLLYTNVDPYKQMQLALNPIFMHFIHSSLLSLGINSFVSYSLIRYMESMYGVPTPIKIILLSFIAGYFTIEYLKNNTLGFRSVGNDVFIRGLAYAVMMKNPMATFYMIPLPFPIKAWIAGLAGLGLDLLANYPPGLAGIAVGCISSQIFI